MCEKPKVFVHPSGGGEGGGGGGGRGGHYLYSSHINDNIKQLQIKADDWKKNFQCPLVTNYT